MTIPKLRYQTGTATLIQLIVMLLLNFATALQSIASACLRHNGCVSNAMVTILYVILLAVWLVFLSMLGYTAQEKRSKRLAQALIVGESFVAIVALFDIRHYPNVLGLITSTIDLALAVWVITLAYRLSKSGGGRIPATSRNRRRPAPKS
jgi:cytochrome bd-type quinol oxidase subunit 2